MLFATPLVTESEARAIDQIRGLQKTLRYHVAEPRRWLGQLRRTAFARAIQASNSIEGYNVSLDDAVAAVAGEDPLEAHSDTWAAIVGYRNALTYVLQLADDPHFTLTPDLVRSLHFMMTSYDLGNRPGRWRAGDIYVRREPTGEIVYEGPDADEVPDLIAELMERLSSDADHPPMIRAAMAHLNLVMVHPFKDGNGRMSRCLQTLVLAREGILAPQFCSVEEYLGANTDAYYRVLGQVGQGRWNPEGDARPWVRFILDAHYRQAQTLLRRVKESERLWTLLENEVERAGGPERSLGALFDAASGFRVRNATYRAACESEVSEYIAGRDLKTLVEAGLLEPHGEKRGRWYSATPRIANLRRESRLPEISGRSVFDAA